MPYQLLVTAAIIERNGKYLITKRPDDGRHNGGRWEFPGGKVNFGEDPRECLAREIKEELGIEIKVNDVFDYSSFIYGEEKQVVLLGFHCDYTSGEIQRRDIADYAWVGLSEMTNYDISEADLPFIEKLRK